MIKYIPDNIPESWGCQVVGRVYDSDDKADLTEDMLEILLPNDLLVCVGWHPEGSANGTYVITTSIGLQDIVEPRETGDAFEAVLWAKEQADTFRWRNMNVSRSDASPETSFPAPIQSATVSQS